MQVAVQGLSKAFDQTAVLHDINLLVPEGQFCALLGPSGSGKTTLLRIIAGLEFADRGRVLFDQLDVADRSARDRQVGFVFQHYALFRHMTIADNVAFGLQVRDRKSRPAAPVIARRVAELLELVQLGEYGARYPDQLSGGQRQRVALARALAIEPRVLLLDEPFGALDARVRKDMRTWLRGLQSKLGLTSILVTHDQDEALELADSVAVMEHGHIIQCASPQAIYDQPATPAVYEFLGGANRLTCRVSDGQLFISDVLLGSLAAADDKAADLYVRAHDIELLPAAAGAGLQGELLRLTWGGGMTHALVRLQSGSTVEVDVPPWSAQSHSWAVGQAVSVRPRRYGVFGSLAGAHPAASVGL